MKSKRIAAHSGPEPFIPLLEDINEMWVREDRSFGVPTDTDEAVTGEPYATLAGVAEPPSRKAAWILGLNLFGAYARNRHGDLYWRAEPSIERIRTPDGWGYKVVMRLLISDNPIVPRILAEVLGTLPECM